MQTPAAPACARPLVYLHRHDTRSHRGRRRDIRGYRHAYVTAVTALLAGRAPGLLKVLRENDSDFVPLDGTLAERDRVGDSRADYSVKHDRRGVNV